MPLRRSVSPSHQLAGRNPMSEAVLSQVCTKNTRNQREVLRSFFDHSGMCMAKLDSTVRLVEANADFSRQFGRLPAELCGTRFCDLLDRDARTRGSEQFTRLLAQLLTA